MTDFNHIPPRHEAINERLEEWARWVQDRPQAWKSQPMFRQYRSHAWQWHRPEIVIKVNPLQAHEIERAVALLPEKHRTAIRWAYVFSRVHPSAVQRALGVTKDALMQLIDDSRDMLKNRLQKPLAHIE